MFNSKSAVRDVLRGRKHAHAGGSLTAAAPSAAPRRRFRFPAGKSVDREQAIEALGRLIEEQLSSASDRQQLRERS